MTTINSPQIITGMSNCCLGSSYSISWHGYRLAGRLIIIGSDYYSARMGGRPVPWHEHCSRVVPRCSTPLTTISPTGRVYRRFAVAGGTVRKFDVTRVRATRNQPTNNFTTPASNKRNFRRIIRYANEWTPEKLRAPPCPNNLSACISTANRKLTPYRTMRPDKKNSFFFFYRPSVIFLFHEN